MITKQGQGYPLYVKGDPKIIQRLKLFLYTSISLPKNIQISVPFIPKTKQITPLLQPIINVQIIDEPIRQQIMKNKYQLKIETLYIYYPCQFKVDEKVYKSLIKTFQNLLDQIPRNIRSYTHKLIIWEDAKGQNTVEMQKLKINQNLSQLAKQLIQAKLNTFITQIRQYQAQPSTQKSLLHIFLLKNKLACLYSHLSLKNFAYDLYADVWNQMMVNFRCLMKLSPAMKLSSNQKLEAPQDVPQSPYTFQNTNDVLGYFQNTHSTAYLRIVTHSFMKFYNYSISLGLVFQAITKLKSFLDFILNNVLVLSRRNQWTKQQMKQFDIARNLWAIQVIFKCLKQLQGKNNNQIGKNIQNEISKVHVSICSMLRNSVQRVGLILYQFDNYSIFPGCQKKQLGLIIQEITKLKQLWRVYKKSIQSLQQQNVEQPVLKKFSLMRRQQFVFQVPETGSSQLKLKSLISNKLIPPEQITNLLINFQAYSQVYLKVLQTMYNSLKNSPYMRVAKSLKMTLQRATIMLGDWQDYKKVHDQPQQFTNFWPQLHSIQKLYRLFFLFVKILANQLPQASIISHQLVDVLKDQYLKQQQQKLFQIANSILETFQSNYLKCNIAKAEKLQLKEDLTITIKIKGDGILSLLNKASNWNLITQQTMLDKNIKKYKLKDIKARQFNKCQNCKKQCKNLCMQSPTIYTQIICKIQTESIKQQALFFIKQISLQISGQEYNLLLYIQVTKDIQKQLYQINIPKLQLLGQEKNNNIYAQIWTPILFKLSSFLQPVLIQNVQIRLTNNFQQQIKEDGQVKWLNSNIEEKQKQQQSPFTLSDNFYISPNVNSKNQVINYHKFNQNLQILINQGSEPYFITFFVKSKKIQKIQRNSRKKIDQMNTNQLISIQIALKSNTLNKEYKLKSKSRTLVITPLLLLQYNMVQTFEQFMLTNLHSLPVKIIQHQNQQQFQKQFSSYAKSQKNYLCQLDKSESVCVESRYITLCPSHYLHMQVHINLNDWFDAESLLKQKSNTFRISYKTQHCYKVFKPIQIQSQIIGTVNVSYMEQSSTQQGYEMIGKVKGEVKYIYDKFINMWVVPIRTGNIILPEIQINGKKGIWVNSLITNIQG